MDVLDQAAEAISTADALLIGAGAGMGVDSGLPDFRGDQGFWKSYPPFEKLGLSFIDMANPRWFDHDPARAWGFYGHRLHLYRDTKPHDGFDVLRRWGEQMPAGHFVFTSNVDGQFQVAGFEDDRICECHGSIHYMQCASPCGQAIWDGHDVDVEIDDEIRASEPLPACPYCAGVARPNILMFGDGQWLSERTHAQETAFARWVRSSQNVVVIECGAGTAVPTVRWQCERVAASFGGTLIRINPREAHGPPGTLSIPRGAADALREIDRRL